VSLLVVIVVVTRPLALVYTYIHDHANEPAHGGPAHGGTPPLSLFVSLSLCLSLSLSLSLFVSL